MQNSMRKKYYDVANNLISAQFDGTGNISKYSVINKWSIIDPDCFYSGFTFNGKLLDITQQKKVFMIGKNAGSVI